MERFGHDNGGSANGRYSLKTGSPSAEQTKQLQSEIAFLEVFQQEELWDDRSSKEEKEEVLKIRQGIAKAVLTVLSRALQQPVPHCADGDRFEERGFQFQHR